MISRNTLGNLILEGVTSFQESHGSQGGQYPGQLGDLGHIGLDPENAFFRIKPQGKKISRCLQGIGGKTLWIMNRGEGMKIDDKGIKLATIHVLDHRLHHAEIITNMKLTRGLDS